MKNTVIDLNADLGEMETQQGRKAERNILSYVSSVNIACGAHAGSPDIMREMVIAAQEKGVVIGAHPGFEDRENFGRKPLQLGVDVSAKDLSLSLIKQVVTLVEIAAQQGAPVRYVKPHGALYTQAAKEKALADLIAHCVNVIDPQLTLMGAPDSELERAAKDFELPFIGEGFIDRRYQASGHLVPRGRDGAVITDQQEREEQLLSLALRQSVTTNTQEIITVNARSLCLHGDSHGAVETARRACKALDAAGVTVKSFINANA